MSSTPSKTIGSKTVNYRIKEGWLSKRGHVIKNWKKRFFVLDGLHLSYYAKLGDGKPKGIITLDATSEVLDNYLVSSSGGSKTEKPAPVSFSFTVRLTPTNTSGSHPFYQLAAASDAEKAAWIDSIRYNIKVAAGDVSVLPGAVDRKASSISNILRDLPSVRGSFAFSPASDSKLHSPRSFAGGWTSATWHSGVLPPSGATDATNNTTSSFIGLECPTPPSESPGRSFSALSFSSTSSFGAGSLFSGGSLQFSGELPSSVRIWTGTWNMAEAPPPQTMCDKLLPPGADIYALSLQECMHTDAVFAAVRGYLGPDFLSVDHRIGGTIKGLGFHGHIALGVFVAEWVVASGICKLSRAVRGSVSLGVNLVVTRVANKGAVAIALPLRLPDADGALTVPSSLVFTSCHLASDNKGTSRIGERMKNAQEIIEALGLELGQHAVARAAYQAQAVGSFNRTLSTKSASKSNPRLSSPDFIAAQFARKVPAKRSSYALASSPFVRQGIDPAAMSEDAAAAASRHRSRSVDATLSHPAGALLTPSNAIHSLVQSEPAGSNTIGQPRLSVARISSSRVELPDVRPRHHSLAETAPRHPPLATRWVNITALPTIAVNSTSIAEEVVEETEDSVYDTDETPRSIPKKSVSTEAAAETNNEPSRAADSRQQDMRRLSSELLFSEDGHHTHAHVTPENPLGISQARSYIFVSGDLNFRVQLPFEDCIRGVATASAAVSERLKRSGNILGRPPTGDSSRDAHVSEQPWMDILRHDQLRQMLGSGAAFKGFTEPPITFPPSYRVRKSDEPVCLRSRGDFANLDRVRELYTVKEVTPTSAGDLADNDGSNVEKSPVAEEVERSTKPSSSKIRTPSYTDRVIVRLPLLAGMPVSISDYRKELHAKRLRRASKMKSGFSTVGAAPEEPHAVAAGADGKETFTPLPHLTCMMYDTVDALAGSDHHPVVSVWELPLSLPAPVDGSSPPRQHEISSSSVSGHSIPVHLRSNSNLAGGDAPAAFPSYVPFPIGMPSALEVLMELQSMPSISDTHTAEGKVDVAALPEVIAPSPDLKRRRGKRSSTDEADFSDVESDGSADAIHEGEKNSNSTLAASGPDKPAAMVNTGGRVATGFRLAPLLVAEERKVSHPALSQVIEAENIIQSIVAQQKVMHEAKVDPNVVSQHDFYVLAVTMADGTSKAFLAPPPPFLFPGLPPVGAPPPPDEWPLQILQNAGISLLDLPVDTAASPTERRRSAVPPPPRRYRTPQVPPRPADARTVASVASTAIENSDAAETPCGLADAEDDEAARRPEATGSAAVHESPPPTNHDGAHVHRAPRLSGVVVSSIVNKFDTMRQQPRASLTGPADLLPGQVSVKELAQGWGSKTPSRSPSPTPK